MILHLTLLFLKDRRILVLNSMCNTFLSLCEFLPRICNFVLSNRLSILQLHLHLFDLVPLSLHFALPDFIYLF